MYEMPWQCPNIEYHARHVMGDDACAGFVPPSATTTYGPDAVELVPLRIDWRAWRALPGQAR